MDLSLVISSFLAGLLTFLAPCTLPLIPGYIGFISGVSVSNKESVRRFRWHIISSSILYCVGFSLVFILFGAAAGLAGQYIVPYRIWFMRAGGIFVILLGLSTLGVWRVNFFNWRIHPKISAFLKKRTLSTAFLLGVAFALGWTPCIGPLLATILLLATTTATAWQGVFLLCLFALGLALPFITIALFLGSVLKYAGKMERVYRIVGPLSGVFLIVLGFLLLTNSLYRITGYTFWLLEWTGYRNIMDFL